MVTSVRAIGWRAPVVMVVAVAERDRNTGGQRPQRAMDTGVDPRSCFYERRETRVWKRLRLKARQTRPHSPATASAPRNEN